MIPGSGCASRWCGGKPVGHGARRCPQRCRVRSASPVAPVVSRSGSGNCVARGAPRRCRGRPAGGHAHRGGAHREHAVECARSPGCGFAPTAPTASSGCCATIWLAAGLRRCRARPTGGRTVSSCVCSWSVPEGSAARSRSRPNASEGLDHIVVTDLEIDRAEHAVAGLDERALHGARARRLRRSARSPSSRARRAGRRDRERVRPAPQPSDLRTPRSTPAATTSTWR